MKNITAPKILIVGTGSLLNYGCEAIVQGTYALVRKYWPESQLFVASDDIAYDRKLFEGCEKINLVPYKKRVTPYRVLMGVFRRMGFGYGSPVRMNCSIIDKYDIFLSAGGDNFAQAPDGSLYHLLLDLMKIGDKANKLKKFYVLWGASIGPFSEENLRKIRENLMKANALFPREKISFNYLKLIGIADEKNHLVADPAFWMKPDYAQMPIEKKSNELIIGLNISSLSIKVSFENYQLGTKIVFSALDSLLKKNPRCRFLCIPHVMTIIGGSQDDFSFMRLYKQFTKFKNRVDILDFGLGARKTKAIISQCDLLIASRMHCCVAGISSGTPTLFLTYSQKGIGMAKYAYDDLEMLLQIQQVSKESLYQKFKYIEKKLHHYKEHLNFQHDRFKSDAAAAMIILKNLYTKN